MEQLRDQGLDLNEPRLWVPTAGSGRHPAKAQEDRAQPAPFVQPLPKTDEQGGLMAQREAQENRAGPPMAPKAPGLAWNPLHKKHLTPCSALNICQFDANGIDARTTGHRTS